MVETYKVVTGRWDTEIIERVNNWVQEGWVLHGGVSVAVGPAGTIFAQAMIKPFEEIIHELIDETE